jgi:hypothetical protein
MNTKTWQRVPIWPWALVALVFVWEGQVRAQEVPDAGMADSGIAEDEVVGGRVDDQDAKTSELTALKDRIRLLEDQVREESMARVADRKEGEKTKQKVQELSEAIQFSGFFDMSVSTYKNNPNVFSLGSFEFDLKKEFNHYFQVGAALVFADSQADLAVGFIDLHLFGGLIPARGNIFLERGFHLQVGRFDIPFGNDWLYFASLDRPSISAPLTTVVLMDGGYNDVGFRVLGNYKFMNYSGYVLQGTGNGVAVGGRIAFIPFNNPFTLQRMDTQPLDLGISYLRDYSQGGRVEQETYVADLEARYKFLRLQGEYYHRHDQLNQTQWRGFQGALYGTFLEEGPAPFGIGVRLDHVESKSTETTTRDRLSRGTLSSYLRLFEVTVLKLEYSHYVEGEGDLYDDGVFAQLVIGFK